MLLKLARNHAIELRGRLSVARQVLGPAHPKVGEIKSELLLAVDAVRTLYTEPERVAA
jgi:hypothetical protein